MGQQTANVLCHGINCCRAFKKQDGETEVGLSRRRRDIKTGPVVSPCAEDELHRLNEKLKRVEKIEVIDDKMESEHV